MNILELVTQDQLKENLPIFHIGDTIKVHFEVTEGDKTRIQIFQGILICRKNSGIRETITVRKISSGVGVERIFPIHSPKVKLIETVRHGRVRRSKLYYLRKLSGKAARIREKRTFSMEHTEAK